MSMLSIGVMVVAVIGMLVGLSKQKAGAAWGKPVAIACIIVALGVALLNIGQTVTGNDGNTAGVVKAEMYYQKVGGKKLGMYLAEKFPGSKVLVITEPTMGAAASTPNNTIEGLKEGFGTSITVVDVVSPDIPKELKGKFSAEMPPAEMAGGEGMEEMLPPLEYWFTGPVLDKLLGKYEGKFDMVVTTIGLPQNGLKNCKKLWKVKPKVAIANGSIYEYKGLFLQKYIAAAVTYNPGAKYDDDTPPKDLDAAFDKRFLLVTMENVNDIAAKHGDIFKK
ncbi:MAG: hypothetical protein KAI66_14155 [Lentisphaeria bacterium]|nr:hypothetical protein [Lentisphaeria bacterium]